MEIEQDKENNIGEVDKANHGEAIETRCETCRFYDKKKDFCLAFLHTCLFLLENGVDTEDCGQYQPFPRAEETIEEEKEQPIQPKGGMDMRPIIKNKDFQVIAKAAKEGDPKAKAIIDKYSAKATQEDIDRMVAGFYEPKAEPLGLEPQTPIVEEEKTPTPVTNPLGNITGVPANESPEQTIAANKVEELQANIAPAIDISKKLDEDLDGIIDRLDIDPMAFRDFISKKKRDNLRQKRNRDHFSSYDPEGRSQYLTSKKDEYGHSFDGKRKDIDRSFRDMDGAIGGYIVSVSDLPDDGIEAEDGIMSDIYEKITGDDDIMGSFGRSWDQEDDAALKATLQSLVQQYGKNNVVGVLNSIKADNSAFHDLRHGQIEQETKRYGKSLDDLLG